jgi:hypothetical protein
MGRRGPVVAERRRLQVLSLVAGQGQSVVAPALARQIAEGSTPSFQAHICRHQVAPDGWSRRGAEGPDGLLPRTCHNHGLRARRLGTCTHGGLQLLV